MHQELTDKPTEVIICPIASSPSVICHNNHFIFLPFSLFPLHLAALSQTKPSACFFLFPYALRVKITIVLDTKSLTDFISWNTVPSFCCNRQYLIFLSHCSSCHPEVLLGTPSQLRPRMQIAGLACFLYHSLPILSWRGFLSTLIWRVFSVGAISQPWVIQPSHGYSALRSSKGCLNF